MYFSQQVSAVYFVVSRIAVDFVSQIDISQAHTRDTPITCHCSLLVGLFRNIFVSHLKSHRAIAIDSGSCAV